MKQAIVVFCLLVGMSGFAEAADRQKSFGVAVEPASDLKGQVHPPVAVVASAAGSPAREKSVRKRLKFRMVSPAQSDNLRFKDSQVTIALTVDESQMQLSLTNNSPFPIRILWQRARYTDATGQNHRVMHPGIRYEERNRSFPYQTVMPFMTIHQLILPVDMLIAGHTTRPLFPPDEVERIKDRTFDLLIPIDVENKGVVPYALKVKVLGMVPE